MASKNDQNFIAFCEELRAYVKELQLDIIKLGDFCLYRLASQRVMLCTSHPSRDSISVATNK